MYINAEDLKQAIAVIAHIPLTQEEDCAEPINSPEYLLRGNFAPNHLLLTVGCQYEGGFVSLKASKPDDDDPSSQSDGNEVIVSFSDFCETIKYCMGDVEFVIRGGDLGVTYQGVREWVLKQPIAFPKVPLPPTPNLVVPTAKLIKALEKFGDEQVWLYVQNSKLHVAGETVVSMPFDRFEPTLDKPDPYSLVTASTLLDAVLPHKEQSTIRLSIDGVYLTVQGLDNVIQGVTGFKLEDKTPPHHLTSTPETVKKPKKVRHLKAVPDPVPTSAPEPEPIAVLETPVCVLQAKTAIEQFLEDLDRLSEAGDEALYLIAIQTLRDNLSDILPKSKPSKPSKPKAQARVKTVKPKTQKKPKAATTSDRTSVIPSEKFAEIEEMYTLKQTMTAREIAEIFTGRGRPMGDTTVSQYIATYIMLKKSKTAKDLFLSGQVKWSDVYAMSRKVKQWGIEKIEEYLLDKAKQSA